jgi:omega-6 fatty acid desaturase (delta-12 desaturase)
VGADPRAAPGSELGARALRAQDLATDVALVAILAGLCAVFGWHAVLLVQLPAAMLAGAVGIWLFYVQHQFEDVYWERKDEWSYVASALQGSSHLRLPTVLRFFTGNIGLHHVHHLQPRIPSYNLQRAHDENPVLHAAPELSLRDAVLALRLKLYDERSGRLVTFAQARHAVPAPPRPGPDANAKRPNNRPARPAGGTLERLAARPARHAALISAFA